MKSALNTWEEQLWLLPVQNKTRALAIDSLVFKIFECFKSCDM